MGTKMHFKNSEEMLERTLRTIPLGSQTFSKSKTQYPYGVSPFFIQKAKGSKVYDVDNNEYIDFASALGAISLGYNNLDVLQAVKAQLEEGTIFSLPHPIENLAAEKIIEIVPCAQMVRFGKNGSDATSGAVRLARAYTEREYVIACGYHGWQDWYIGSTQRNKGVPKSTQELTLTVGYNNLHAIDDLFKKHPNKIACVIMEAMNYENPKEGYLEGIKEICHKNGALFILDEMITGFRFSNGGAQEYFGVTPDLTTLGKGMSNGYPISAIAGRREIMQLLDDVFFSFTYGGETLSLAATIATINKYQKNPVIEHLKNLGNKIKNNVSSLITEYDLQKVINISGHPSWTLLKFSDTEKYSQWQIKTLYMQEVLSKGILTIGSHMLTYAHTEKDIDILINTYDEVFKKIALSIKNNSLEKELKCKPLEPLFKVR